MLADVTASGPVRLISPVIDLSGTDGTINYARWHFTDLGIPDTLVTEITMFGLNLQPGLAYPVHEKLSIGAAASAIYMDLDMDIAASTELGAPTVL